MNSYKYITSIATTTFAGNELNRVILASININQPLTGTLTIKSDSTVIGIITAGTAAGQYWYSSGGQQIADLTILNSANENITVFYRNI